LIEDRLLSQFEMPRSIRLNTYRPRGIAMTFGSLNSTLSFRSPVEHPRDDQVSDGDYLSHPLQLNERGLYEYVLLQLVFSFNAYCSLLIVLLSRA
jgi:hypothetical protein